MNKETARRVIIVEDDERLADMIASFLSDHGFRAEVENDGAHAIARVLRDPPDVVVLDVMLPGADGFTICRRLRSANFKRPILMLTARTEDIDEVEALEDGADDYVRKPVRPRVLLARLNALLRRRHAESARQATLKVGRLRVDRGNRSVRFGDERVELTDAEFDLLEYLASHAGSTVSRDQIYRDVRGVEYDGIDRSIDLRISRLRKKLGEVGGAPTLIKAVRGVGYLMVANA